LAFILLLTDKLLLKVIEMKMKFIAVCSLIVAVSVPKLNAQAIEVMPILEPVDEHAQVLIADQDKKKAEVTLDKIISLEEMLIEEEEDLLFPADELYGSNWDNRWVDPFRADPSDVVFPDSCDIDCSSFIMPINLDMVRVTSKYGPRRRRMHKGIDLKVQIGDTIYAAFAGKVRIRNTERRGYGNYLVLRHPNGLETVYGHLSGWLVDVNDVVRAGEPIALGGNTGRSTGPHLHFETRFLGQALNPADIIDFESGSPYKDLFVFHNIKINGRNSNIYTASDEQVIYYTVKSGDNLGSIARRYNTSVTELCRLNGLKSTSMLRIGQSLRCGIGKTTNSTASSTASVAANDTTTITQATQPAVAPKAAPKSSKTITASTTMTDPDKGSTYHRIQAGDTLGAIAQKYGTTVSTLCELNGISKTTVLKLGRSLKCS
jgi:murein DD-endopeptidase MepM/ murein hydrolase activator NlpD